MQLQNRLQDAEASLQRLVTDLFLHNKEENAHDVLHYLEHEYIQFMQQVKEMCHQVWAKFDLLSMGLGVMCIIVNIILNIFVLSSVQGLSTDTWSGSVVMAVAVSCVFLVYSIVQSVYLEGTSVGILGFILGIFDVATLGFIIQMTRSNKCDQEKRISPASFQQKISLQNIVLTIIVLINLLCYFSNSFVVFEDDISLFSAQTLIWFICAKAVFSIFKDSKHLKESVKGKSRSGKPQEIGGAFLYSVLPILALTIACSFCVRLSKIFRSQREEQLTLDQWNDSLSTRETVDPSNNKNLEFFVSAACLVLLVYLPRRWLADSGNLNGVSGPVVCARYLLPAAAVCTIAHWALQVCTNSHYM